jgi:hypothetical protein
MRTYTLIEITAWYHNMPTKPLDILNCTLEEFFHQMDVMKNIFKRTVVSDSRGHMHSIATLTKLGAGNTVIPQDFEQRTSKERQESAARLHFRTVDLVIMQQPSRLGNVGLDSISIILRKDIPNSGHVS